MVLSLMFQSTIIYFIKTIKEVLKSQHQAFSIFVITSFTGLPYMEAVLDSLRLVIFNLIIMLVVKRMQWFLWKSQQICHMFVKTIGSMIILNGDKLKKKEVPNIKHLSYLHIVWIDWLLSQESGAVNLKLIYKNRLKTEYRVV